MKNAVLIFVLVFLGFRFGNPFVFYDISQGAVADPLRLSNLVWDVNIRRDVHSKMSECLVVFETI